MNTDEIEKSVASYLSFALSSKSQLTLGGHFNYKGEFVDQKVELDLKDVNRLSTRELSTIEELMDKYQIFKSYLPTASKHDEIKIVANSNSDEGIKENAEGAYHLVKIDNSQLDLAKAVAVRIESIHSAVQRGEHRNAKSEHNELKRFLSDKKAKFIGDFRSLDDIESALGLPVRPQETAAIGALVFVAAKIFVNL